jgi:uncharacterized protein (TIGR02594 family)
MTLQTPPPRQPAHYVRARGEIGQKEAPGTADNPRIVEYLRTTNLDKKYWHDATAHCAAFVCWVLEQEKLPNPRYAKARNFLHYGSALTEPRLGCLVILWRTTKDAPRGQVGDGHIGFYVKSSAERLLLLGANQHNEVCEQYYPAIRLLEYRWPPGVPLL